MHARTCAHKLVCTHLSTHSLICAHTTYLPQNLSSLYWERVADALRDTDCVRQCEITWVVCQGTYMHTQALVIRMYAQTCAAPRRRRPPHTHTHLHSTCTYATPHPYTHTQLTTLIHIHIHEPTHQEPAAPPVGMMGKVAVLANQRVITSMATVAAGTTA